MREYFNSFNLHPGFGANVFANRANRSVKDAMAAALHAAWPQTSSYLNPVEHLLDVLNKQV